jgi:Mlc titration factor MtfA (ptsG expression regulator)
VLPFSKKARRKALREQPTPEAWSAIVDKNVPYAALLEADDRRELEALVRIFLAEKHFEGCGGLSVTDEMRVTIAAQACLLLLHRETDMYPALDTILVYPHPYRAHSEHRVGGLVVESDSARLGESWTRGVVVLAWDHVRAATHHATEGHNLVLHEFAHQLDAEAGPMDGAPPLDGRMRYEAWARVLGAEYAALSERLSEGRPSDIDPYGSTSPAEFFAVVTEMFFERPAQLARRHPELYAELAAFYQQDPAALRDRRAPAEQAVTMKGEAE